MFRFSIEAMEFVLGKAIEDLPVGGRVEWGIDNGIEVILSKLKRKQVLHAHVLDDMHLGLAGRLHRLGRQVNTIWAYIHRDLSPRRLDLTEHLELQSKGALDAFYGQKGVHIPP